MTIKLVDPAATHALGRALATRLRIGDVVALQGPLGAGKTSFARGLLDGLGLVGEAPSPSFAIAQPYTPPDVRLAVAHVDLYRIDDPRELDELGLDDALLDGALIVEWPERAGEGAWPEALVLRFAIERDDGRVLTAIVPAAWENRWPT